MAEKENENKMLGEMVHYCSKCKLELNHRIILMDGDGDTPARMLCLTCNTERKYKVPSQATLKRSRKNAEVLKKKAQEDEKLNEWREQIKDESVSAKKYKLDETFAINEHVDHSKFGRGLVVGFDHPDKIHVFFEEGIKILKGNKAA